MTMYVMTHKKFDYVMPKEYKKILVGANNQSTFFTDSYLKDNKGLNISIKNKYFCELTGLFWIWKNIDDVSVGVSHYRRYFSKYNLRKFGTILEYIEVLIRGEVKPIHEKKLKKLLLNFDWIVPNPVKLANNEKNLKENYSNAHNIEDLEKTREVLKKLYPSFVKSFDTVMERNELIQFNMFYTTKSNFNEYAKWLFSILFEVEKIVDISDYDEYQKRIFGFLSERLLNVWLFHKNYKVKYMRVYDTRTRSRNYVLKRLKLER